MDIDRAFAEWCAVLGFALTSPKQAGPYRLATTADGNVTIELLRQDGSVEVIGRPMAEAAFCDAVELVSASFRLKTIQVARTVARRLGKSRQRER